MNFKKVVILLATVPFWVACQSSTTSQENAAVKAAQVEHSSQSSTEGVWLIEPLAKQIETDGDVIRCGEKNVIPQVIAVDASGNVEVLPRLNPALLTLPEAPVYYGPIFYQNMTSLNIQDGELNAIHKRGREEQSVRFVRSTEAEALEALKKQAECETRVAAANRNNEAPATKADLENQAILAKNTLATAVNGLISTEDLETAAVQASVTAAAVVGSVGLNRMSLKNKAAEDALLKERDAFSNELIEKQPGIVRETDLKNAIADKEAQARKIARKARIQKGGSRLMWLAAAVTGFVGGKHLYDVYQKPTASEQIAQNDELAELVQMSDADLRSYVAANPEAGYLLIKSKAEIIK